MGQKRAIIDAEVDDRAREYGLDGPTLRRARSSLRAFQIVTFLIVAIFAGAALGLFFSDVNVLLLFGGAVIGVTIYVVFLYAGSFGERLLPTMPSKAISLGAASAAIVASEFIILSAFGWRVEVLFGLGIAALTSLSLAVSVPRMTLIALTANRPSLPADMHYLSEQPVWQTGLNGKTGLLRCYGAAVVSGLIAEAVAVFLAPHAVVAFAILAAVVAVGIYLLRRRPGIVLAFAALYPVVVIGLALLLA